MTSTYLQLIVQKLYLDPNDGHQDFFCEVANAYWDKVQEQFHFKTHLDNKWFNSQGELVCTNEHIFN